MLRTLCRRAGAERSRAGTAENSVTIVSLPRKETDTNPAADGAMAAVRVAADDKHLSAHLHRAGAELRSVFRITGDLEDVCLTPPFAYSGIIKIQKPPTGILLDNTGRGITE